MDGPQSESVFFSQYVFLVHWDERILQNFVIFLTNDVKNTLYLTHLMKFATSENRLLKYMKKTPTYVIEQKHKF